MPLAFSTAWIKRSAATARSTMNLNVGREIRINPSPLSGGRWVGIPLFLMRQMGKKTNEKEGRKRCFGEVAAEVT
jgi:hypothetical protein